MAFFFFFTKFPELASSPNQNHLKDLLSENKKSQVPECRSSEDGPGVKIEEQHKCSSVALNINHTEMPPVEENVTQKLSHLEICVDEFPGSSATYRILEVTPLYCPDSGVNEAVVLYMWMVQRG